MEDIPPTDPLTYEIEVTIGLGEGQYRSIRIVVPCAVIDLREFLAITVEALAALPMDPA